MPTGRDEKRTGMDLISYNMWYILSWSTDIMPQICLYLDDEVQEMTKIRAKERGSSVPSYVNEILRRNNEDRPPAELLELFGSWESDPMKEPEELPWSMDLERKRLSNTPQWSEMCLTFVSFHKLRFQNRLLASVISEREDVFPETRPDVRYSES